MKLSGSFFISRLIAPMFNGYNRKLVLNMTKSNMRKPILLVIILCLYIHCDAQRYKSFEGFIGFYSEAPIENIDAKNEDVASIIDISTMDIVFSVPIQSFEFDKSLMQQHFNEKYMESEKYPKSVFKGKIFGLDASKNAKQNVTARGQLTIHGVTHTVDIPGAIMLRDGNLHLTSQFPIKIEDYKVKVPQLLWKNIAEVVQVTVDLNYKIL
ncbi:MAG TPA: YceI family protein [Fulvivirga sp.]|nr:YceI family protein [Fulvivirga sp.]